MTTTTAAFTVWDREKYTASTEVWSGPEFSKALQAAVDAIGSGTAAPLDHTAIPALRAFGKPISAWSVTDPDGTARIVFITR